MLLKLFLKALHNIKYNYVTTASHLKEIMNHRFCCVKYYLLSDAKTTSDNININLNNIRVLLKGVLIDLGALNFVHAKTSLRAYCVHARRLTRNLLSPDNVTKTVAKNPLFSDSTLIFLCHSCNNKFSIEMTDTRGHVTGCEMLPHLNQVVRKLKNVLFLHFFDTLEH